MKAIAGDILKRIPRRRPRQWRYVSPGRRGVGMVLLLVLTVLMAAWWFGPRLLNAWTRDLAAGYLHEFTGGRIGMGEASFRLFGGIELHGVSVDVPNSPGPDRLLSARTILLHHNPWSLFTEGRLEPTEIICIAPTVTLGYDANEGTYTAEKLLETLRARGGGAPDFTGPLPVVSIRDVRLSLPEGRTRVNLSMIPSGRAYRIAMEERRPGQDPIRATWHLDLEQGRMRLEESNIPRLSSTDPILPDRFRQWRKRYAIRGTVVLKGSATTAPSGSILDAHLNDVSLTLPPNQGGLELVGVSGVLSFSDAGVVARDLAGSIPQAGGATFRMDGRYGGYDANSPFELHARLDGLALPDASGATGWLAETIDTIAGAFEPTGRINLAADFRRGGDGEIRVSGKAWPKGMSFRYEKFPCRLSDVEGEIHFRVGPEVQLVDLVKVTGVRDGGPVTLHGRIDLRKEGGFEMTVSARNVPLDRELRNALPKHLHRRWDAFDPRGRGSADVRVWQVAAGREVRADAKLRMNGKTSLTYEGFPYRLEGLEGAVDIREGKVKVDTLVGHRGPMRCTIDGTISGFGRDDLAETDLIIDVTDLPLDGNLLAALPPASRKAAASLRPGGRAERATARLLQPPGEELDFRVVVHLADASLCPNVLPYAVTDAAGLLTVRPGRVIIEELTGRHGETDVSVTGQVLMEANTPAADVRVRATGVTMDGRLRALLPEPAREAWDRFRPTGLADVDLSLRSGLDDAPGGVDWRLVLDGRGLAMRYGDFPYPLTDVTGRAVITPGRVDLSDVRARHGKARFVVNGRAGFSAEAETAELRIRGSDVPIDGELLDSVPRSLAPLARRFRPGGRCDIDLRSLRVVSAGSPGSQPATSAATAPGVGATRWSIDGRVAFHDATLDVGFGHKTLSGSVDGVASQEGPALALKAAVELDRVRVGRQKLTRLRANVSKEPGQALMRVRNLSARAHGGQVAGFAELRLADPLEFGLSLSVDGMKLQELFASAGAEKPEDVRGLLAGSVQLRATAGEKPRRRASGVLRLSKAQLYKLPVMLGLLHVVYLTLPGESAFTEGKLSYHLRDDTLVFDEIYLRGSALSIVGSGTMDMESEKLDLTFLSGPPRKLPPLGSLSELLEGIAREVVEIHVDGPLREPRMRTVPLRSLDRILRDLLHPGRGK